MAILKEMVGLKVIDGFRGVIDFYYYMGLCVVRRWPRSPGKRRAPQVEAQWSVWGYASKLWLFISQDIRDAYNWTAQGSSLTGRDLQMKSFIEDYTRDSQWD